MLVCTSVMWNKRVGEFKNISFGNRFSIFILDNCCPRYNVIFVWFSGGYAGTKIIYREVTSTYSATEIL